MIVVRGLNRNAANPKSANVIYRGFMNTYKLKSGLCYSSLLALCICMLFSGCATAPRQKEVPIGKEGVLGIGLRTINDQLLVTNVGPGDFVERFGLQLNDSIIGYNGRKIESIEDRQAFWREVKASPGKTINLNIDRRGQQIPIKLTISERKVFANEQVPGKLDDELDVHKKVAVAIIVTQIKHVGYAYGSIDETTASVAAKAFLETFYEKFFLDNFGERENFILVDRNRLEELLKELHLQGSGVVSSESVKNIGNITGASHIVFVEWFRYANGKDITNLRLIEVESGTVLAIDTIEHIQPSKEKAAGLK